MEELNFVVWRRQKPDNGQVLPPRHVAVTELQIAPAFTASSLRTVFTRAMEDNPIDVAAHMLLKMGDTPAPLRAAATVVSLETYIRAAMNTEVKADAAWGMAGEQCALMYHTREGMGAPEVAKKLKAYLRAGLPAHELAWLPKKTGADIPIANEFANYSPFFFSVTPWICAAPAQPHRHRGGINCPSPCCRAPLVPTSTNGRRR